MLKLLLAVLACALLSWDICGCGGSSTAADPHKPVKLDRDYDYDKNDDDSSVLDYGQEAVGAERQAILTVVTQYYAAEAAADGAKACALLVPFIAESVVENIGHQPGLRGTSCATVITKLFEQQHQLLSGENKTLKVYTARVHGDKALVVLSFSVLPEVRRVTERRIGGKWKMLYLLDGILE